jgi:myo-inositol-1(or 4)-monophosphatase
MKECRRDLEFALEVAAEAGRLALRHLHRPSTGFRKGDGSMVTTVDLETESLVRGRIRRAYPRHGILGEEMGPEGDVDVDGRWIIDPIDGTRWFARGLPIFGVLLALEQAGTIELGVAHFPAIGETIWATRGGPCYFNGRQCRVSSVDRLESSTISLAEAASFARHHKTSVRRAFERRCQHCLGWDDAYGHMLVATGRIDLMLDPVVSLWDFAPLVPILRSAGGAVVSWTGGEVTHEGACLSAGPQLLGEVVQLVEQTERLDGRSPLRRGGMDPEF